MCSTKVQKVEEIQRREGDTKEGRRYKGEGENRTEEGRRYEGGGEEEGMGEG